MRDETKYLLYYLPQLESSFSYACLALSVGMLSQDEQRSFGQALIQTGNKVLEHSSYPVKEIKVSEYRPRCWVETPFDLHPDIVEKYNAKKILGQGDPESSGERDDA